MELVDTNKELDPSFKDYTVPAYSLNLFTDKSETIDSFMRGIEATYLMEAAQSDQSLAAIGKLYNKMVATKLDLIAKMKNATLDTTWGVTDQQQTYVGNTSLDLRNITYIDSNIMIMRFKIYSFDSNLLAELRIPESVVVKIPTLVWNSISGSESAYGLNFIIEEPSAYSAEKRIYRKFNDELHCHTSNGTFITKGKWNVRSVMTVMNSILSYIIGIILVQQYKAIYAEAAPIPEKSIFTGDESLNWTW